MMNAEGEEVVFHGLAEAVRYWGNWIKEQAERELGQFYPKDPDGATPIAYLWARTITCEGPGCGAEVPLMRSMWLAQKGERSVALRMVPDKQAKRVDFEIVQNAKVKDIGEGTVQHGATSCPVCGYTTAVESVRAQLKPRSGGTNDARLFTVVTTRTDSQGRFYRLPNEYDFQAVSHASAELTSRQSKHRGDLSLTPDEPISLNEIRRISVPVYGMATWSSMFSDRQLLSLTTLSRLVNQVGRNLASCVDQEFSAAIQVCLALAVDKQADLGNALCRWEPIAQCPRQLFARQAVGMVWDFAEGVAIGESSGAFAIQVDRLEQTLSSIGADWASGHVERSSATNHPLPDDSAQALITDPPYYDAVPYAHLSDFFYVWLRRSLYDSFKEILVSPGVPKAEEIVVDRPHYLSTSEKDVAFYERELTKAFAEGRRVLAPNGIGTIVFASKTTASWEAILQAVVEAGWTITGSWPIDT